MKRFEFRVTWIDKTSQRTEYSPIYLTCSEAQTYLLECIKCSNIYLNPRIQVRTVETSDWTI